MTKRIKLRIILPKEAFSTFLHPRIYVRIKAFDIRKSPPNAVCKNDGDSVKPERASAQMQQIKPDNRKSPRLSNNDGSCLWQSASVRVRKAIERQKTAYCLIEMIGCLVIEGCASIRLQSLNVSDIRKSPPTLYVSMEDASVKSRTAPSRTRINVALRGVFYFFRIKSITVKRQRKNGGVEIFQLRRNFLSLVAGKQ